MSVRRTDGISAKIPYAEQATGTAATTAQPLRKPASLAEQAQSQRVVDSSIRPHGAALPPPKQQQVLKPRLVTGKLHTGGSDLIDAALKTGKPVVVMVGASWCGPCKTTKPHFKLAAEQYKDMLFIYVDADQHPEAAEGLRAEGYPTLTKVGRFANGDWKISSSKGSMSKGSMDEWLLEHQSESERVVRRAPLLLELGPKFIKPERTMTPWLAVVKVFWDVVNKILGTDVFVRVALTQDQIEMQCLALLAAGGEPLHAELKALDAGTLKHALSKMLKEDMQGWSDDDIYIVLYAASSTLKAWTNFPSTAIEDIRVISAGCTDNELSHLHYLATTDSVDEMVRWAATVRQLSQPQQRAALAKLLATTELFTVNNDVDYEALQKYRRQLAVVGKAQPVVAHSFDEGRVAAVCMSVRVGQHEIKVFVSAENYERQRANMERLCRCLAKLPADLLKLTDQIDMEQDENGPSASAGNGVVNAFPALFGQNDGALMVTLMHEFGHLHLDLYDEDEASQAAWRLAMDKDHAYVSRYAMESMDEDFAETSALYRVDRQRVERDFPARAAFLKAHPLMH